MCAMVTLDYWIVILGEMDADCSSQFAPLDVAVADGHTTIHARAIDQAALHGILARIAGLGLDLVSVSSSGEWSPPPREGGKLDA
jgi:hypothetical protein